MTYTPNEIIEISLNSQEHNIARQFALEQDTPQKGKQVYLNTLVIFATHNFLEWLGIETDLEMGNSWNPAVRCFHDVADLVIPNLGKLECRPVLLGEKIISLPVEVTEDRIAYIGVQFEEKLNKVQLLGFYPASYPQTQEIEIARLEPIETLIDYIDRIESAILKHVLVAARIAPIATTTIPERIKLDNWLKNIDSLLESGFQTLENYLSILQGDQAFRYSNAPRSRTKETEKNSISITGVKELLLGEHNLALVISCQSENDQIINIILRLYPTGENIYLPSGLRLTVICSEDIFLESIARDTDNWMQLEFSGESEENFSIKVELEDNAIIGNFVI